MRGRDFHRACALLWIGVLIRDNRNLAAHERQRNFGARFEKGGIPFVSGIYRYCHVAEHGLGARGSDNDMIRLVALHLRGERIFEIIEMAVRIARDQLREGHGVERLLVLRLFGPGKGAAFFDRDDFKVGDRGLQLRVPVDEALVLVDQSRLVKLDEHLDDRLRQPLVHGEALAAPIAGRAQALELIDDGAAGMLFPGPDALQELLAAQLAAARLLALHQLPLDEALRRDAGVVGSRLPKHVAPAHPLEPRQHILQRIVERVAHVQRTRHIRRRDHDGKRLRLRVLLERRARPESFRLLPGLEDPRFDIGVIVVLFEHWRRRYLGPLAASYKKIGQLRQPPKLSRTNWLSRCGA